MNPLLLMQIIQAAKAGVSLLPVAMKAYNEIKAAGTVPPDQLEALKAHILELDQAREASWAEADAALDAAALR